MKDLASELKIIYNRAYHSQDYDRVKIMDKVSLALFYICASYTELAWGIANDLGVNDEKAS